MASVSYSPRSKVIFRGQPHVIVRAVTEMSVLVKDATTGQEAVARLSELSAPSEGPLFRPAPPVEALTAEQLKVARQRKAVVDQYLASPRGRRGEVAERLALENGVSTATVSKWARTFQQRRLLSDLTDARLGRPMPKRIDQRREALMKSVIDELYLTRQQLSKSKVYEQVVSRCVALGLKAPHYNTLLARIRDLPEHEVTRRRHGEKAARDRFAMVGDGFPLGDHPLQVVQIDHTQLDIELVDDSRSGPIGRPWLTLAIDTFSRMVVGYYLSLEHPSAFSIGMCIAHAALSKELELTRLEVEGEWPVWGLMRCVHADNGKDFRSDLLERAYGQYGIQALFRPVKRPEFGGHIERLMGTVATEIHCLPGTTFSNIRQKGEYKSGAKASLTLAEIERYLATWIVGVYHNRVHRGIGKSPLEKWRDGIVGINGKPGIGHPPPVEDPRRLRLDLLPAAERAVQREGIVWDHIWYKWNTLARWVGSRKGKNRQTFVVRRDPRDISRIYFLDPKLNEYLEIPYKNIGRPKMALWELRAAKRNMESVPDEQKEDAIFRAHEKLSKIAEDAKDKTRKARRLKARKTQAERKVSEDPHIAPQPPQPPPPASGHALAVVVDNTRAKTADKPQKDSWGDLSNAKLTKFEEL